MNSKLPPAVPGIDLEFRPASYFWPMGLETHLLSQIKGAERKAALKTLIDAGRLDDIPDFLAQSALDEASRAALGRLHPMFMGGEYPQMSGLYRQRIENFAAERQSQGDVHSVATDGESTGAKS